MNAQSGEARQVPRRLRVLAHVAAAAAALLPGSALAQVPPFASGLSYMTAFGSKSGPVLTLLYALIALSLAVVAIIAILVLAGVFWRRAGAAEPALVSIERSGRGLSWIYVGIGLTIPALVGIAAWTYVALAAVASPPGKPAFTIEVTGHQWWWEFRYVSDEPARTFTTANEMHIPAGKPVRIVLETSDVIHSFWIPALTGKMDTINGQHNVTWIEADQPGTFLGQCTEFCGLQHAKMRVLAIADAPKAFDDWWNRQLQAPEPPRSEATLARLRQGEAAFQRHCAVCHAVRGTMAGGRVGPDLSHLMGRRTLAAAAVPNTMGYLSGWISSPQHVKPGNFMPTLALSGPDLEQIRTYLAALK